MHDARGVEHLLDELGRAGAVRDLLGGVGPDLVGAVGVHAHELKVDGDLRVGVVGRAHHAEGRRHRLVDELLELSVLGVGLRERLVLLVGQVTGNGNERVGGGLRHPKCLVGDDGGVARLIGSPARARHGVVARQLGGVDGAGLVALGVCDGAVVAHDGGAPRAEAGAHLGRGLVAAEKRVSVVGLDGLHLRDGRVDLRGVDGLDADRDVASGGKAVLGQGRRDGRGVGAALDVTRNDAVVAVEGEHRALPLKGVLDARALKDLRGARKDEVLLNARQVDRAARVLVCDDLTVDAGERVLELLLLGGDLVGGLGRDVDGVVLRQGLRGEARRAGHRDRGGQGHVRGGVAVRVGDLVDGVPAGVVAARDLRGRGVARGPGDLRDLLAVCVERGGERLLGGFCAGGAGLDGGAELGGGELRGEVLLDRAVVPRER